MNEEYRTIPLTRGRVAIVDASDFEWLNQWKWRSHHAGPYAVRDEARGEAGTRRTIQMHRLILKLAYKDPSVVDHRNGDGLDNRRSNLRITNDRCNAQNARRSKRNKSGYKGVSWSAREKKYRALIYLNRRQISLGWSDDPREAHEMYKRAALEHFGEFARFE